MINIVQIDEDTLLCLVSCYKMLWIFIIIIFRSRSNDETFISCLPSPSQSIYLHRTSLVEERNHVVLQAWFLMTLKMFYCRQFSLSSLINKSSLWDASRADRRCRGFHWAKIDLLTSKVCTKRLKFSSNRVSEGLWMLGILKKKIKKL